MTGLSHKDDLLETPPWLFNQIEKETGLKFNLDIAANHDNHKCEFYQDEFMDALNQEWWYGYKKSKFKNGRPCFEYHWFEGEKYSRPTSTVFVNPPRSKNKKFVEKIYEQWKRWDINIVTLLCWNDLGNKYGERLLSSIINGEILVKNLGKIKFYKNGVETEFPSRLTYFYAWFKRKH